MANQFATVSGKLDDINSRMDTLEARQKTIEAISTPSPSVAKGK